MKTISPAFLGFLRAIAYVAIAAVASWLANSANLSGILNPTMAMFVAGAFASLDHWLESQSGRALFGAVHSS